MASQTPNSTHLKPHFRLPVMASLTPNSAHTKQHFRSRPHRKVRIVAKIRDFLDPEIESSDRVSGPRISVQKPNGESSDGVTILLGDQMESHKESYNLDYYYEQGEDASQIFSKEVKPLLPEIFRGFNASVIAYGARGSGKTHLIQGSNEKPGLAPLALAEILSIGEEIGSSVMISYYEVYQDHVYDLLESKEQKVLVFEDNGGKIKLKGLSQVPVKSISDFNRVYFHECNQRKPGQKIMNDDAPRRTHKGLIIHVSSSDKDSNIRLTGKMNFIDLAGYEDRNRRMSSGSPHPAESVRINKSLYSFQKVVYSLNANDGHIPYRETKLTHMLQDSIGGTSQALMIACLNPFVCQDTIYTLKLAAHSCQAGDQSKNDSSKKINKVATLMTPVTKPQTLSTMAKKSATSRFFSVEKKNSQKPPTTKGSKLFDVASPTVKSVKEHSASVVANDAEPFTRKEDNPLPSIVGAIEHFTSKEDVCLQTECNHLETNDAGFNVKPSVVSGDCNLENERYSSPSSIDGSSPPISVRLREITNTLKSLCSPSPLSSIQMPKEAMLGCSLVSKDLTEPKTPGIPFSLGVSDNLESENTGTPADVFKTRSCGLKKSLVQEYLKFLNSASKEELKQLKGIGEKRANYILGLREEDPEPFKDLDGLKEIGLSTKQINGIMKNVAGGLFT
ncbi:kinesin-like protein KIN-10C isoform X2 [Magnolia sinica]|uniref:kinesin-like protein KIN-10C isoform X2 n=1 Tax=Magnolia sinica TaxID=86752 RepID=UPI002658A096|nr:kinesin-like protein KIN-10C isoform X2 [Magnolia sinica]